MFEVLITWLAKSLIGLIVICMFIAIGMVLMVLRNEFQNKTE